MDENRVIQLQNMLKNSPQDPFLIYALALEYLDHDEKQSFDLFTKLLEDHEDYTPTYYHAAILFSELGKLDLAKSTFEMGMAKTLETKDIKSHNELQNAYQNFLIEFDI